MAEWKKLTPADLAGLRDDPPAPFDWENNTERLPTQQDHSVPPVDWQKFVREIKSMLVGDQYEYAEETLRGILMTVEQTERVTWGQYNAIDNISSHPGRRQDRGNGRWRD